MRDRTTNRIRKQAGMTLIELMVAMTILVLMLSLINEVFQSTQIAVTTGTQNSKVIAATRVIGEQLDEDFNAMRRPSLSNDGGYLVILNKLVAPGQSIESMPIRDPGTLAELPAQGLRLDQIVFVRDALGLRSMTPQGANTFRSSLYGEGTQAKVVYSIAERTEQDGSKRPSDQGLGTQNAGADRVASDFILSRHVLLFDPLDESQDPPAPISAGLGTYVSVANAGWNAPINGSTPGFPGPRVAFMGITDVTTQAYSGNNAAGDMGFIETIRDTLANSGDPNSVTPLYLQTAFTQERFRVNPKPSAAATGYESWAVGQTHGILSPTCSELVVQFAADLNGNGRIDTTAPNGNDQGGEIIWYDGFGSNNPNQTNLQVAGPNAWYRAPGGTGPVKPQPKVAGGLGIYDHAYVFRFDDDAAFNPDGDPQQEYSDWPYMIRIRYRLHDTRGRLTSNNLAALNDGYDNDGDGAADGADPQNDEDKIAGRWFEHIFRVRRGVEQ